MGQYETLPDLPLPTLLRALGFTGAALGIVGVVLSTLVYMNSHEFSFFSTYLSDVGDTGKWPKVLFNTAMLMVAPIRYALLILIVMLFAARGGGRGLNAAILVMGVPVVIGSIGMSAFPASSDVVLHESSALIFFFGVVILQSLIGVQELRLRLPGILPVVSFLVVVIYLIFAVLLALVGTVEAVTRDTPVIWEWMAFLSLMLWLIVHSIVLGRR